jgi:4-amino-4-deoxy-L-arabinose transferase-like glycosyltransferase
VGLTALAGALRIIHLAGVPPGLYHDEAINGLDALRVLGGSYPVYFPANHGREPLFLYLIAASIAALGRTPGAVRLAAAVCGTVTIPITYWMTRAWFKRSTALLSAAILATTLWHVHLSRVGFRAVTLPLVVGAFLAVAGHALRSQRRSAWAAAGLLYGLSFYTYVAVRFTPVPLLALAVYFVCTGRTRDIWPGAIYFSGGALIGLTPLGLYAVSNWDVFMGRPSQVSILNVVVHDGNFWRTLWNHVVRSLGMFFVRGDTIARHNVPGRPVFTLPMGAAMALGAIQAGVRARRGDAGSVLALIWVGAMLVPTVAAADAPHFLRAVGVLPVLAVLPALGLETVRRTLAKQAGRVAALIPICLVLTFSLGSTIRDYFASYAGSTEARYAFESAAVELASEINRFTGQGWDGRDLRLTAQPVDRTRRVYVDSRLWQAWDAVPFLVPERENVVRFDSGSSEPLAEADRMLLLLWPYGSLRTDLSSLPHPATIEVDVGPLTRGDLEHDPYPAYAAYTVTPRPNPGAASIARFEVPITLADHHVDVTRGDGERTYAVRLSWRAEAEIAENHTAFVYLCDERCTAANLLAQSDAQPGTEFYPTSLWRPGDVVVDTRTLQVSASAPSAPTVGVGLYAWPSLERLTIVEPPGPWLDDVLLLPNRD